MRTQDEIDRAAHLLATKLTVGGRHVTDDVVYCRLIDLYIDEDWIHELASCRNKKGLGTLDTLVAWVREEDRPTDVQFDNHKMIAWGSP